jgi:hypothetical protein
MMKRLILRVESQNMIRTLKEAQAGRKKSQLLFIYLFIYFPIRKGVRGGIEREHE